VRHRALLGVFDLNGDGRRDLRRQRGNTARTAGSMQVKLCVRRVSHSGNHFRNLYSATRTERLPALLSERPIAHAIAPGWNRGPTLQAANIAPGEHKTYRDSATTPLTSSRIVTLSTSRQCHRGRQYATRHHSTRRSRPKASRFDARTPDDQRGRKRDRARASSDNSCGGARPVTDGAAHRLPKVELLDTRQRSALASLMLESRRWSRSWHACYSWL